MKEPNKNSDGELVYRPRFEAGVVALIASGVLIVSSCVLLVWFNDVEFIIVITVFVIFALLLIFLALKSMFEEIHITKNGVEIYNSFTKREIKFLYTEVVNVRFCKRKLRTPSLLEFYIRSENRGEDTKYSILVESVDPKLIKNLVPFNIENEVEMIHGY